jgi:hypothetical protein
MTGQLLVSNRLEARRRKGKEDKGLDRFGEVTERPKVQHWKCCVGESSPRVRIPPSPLKRQVEITAYVEPA